MSSSIAATSYDNISDFISAYSSTTTEAESATTTTSDKDMFLNLMVTQMQYQDPLDPQDNSEYLSQMAQFTTLEIMENMSFANEMTEANTMIGKLVSGTSSDGDYLAGVVEGTKVLSGEVYLRINDIDVPLANVQAVSSTTDANTTILDYTKLSYANSLVGKIVSGTETLENGALNDWSALVQSTSVDDEGTITLKTCNVSDGSDRTITVDDVKGVTEMVPAEEDILTYVKSLYEILTATNESSNEIENELSDVTE